MTFLSMAFLYSSCSIKAYVKAYGKSCRIKVGSSARYELSEYHVSSNDDCVSPFCPRLHKRFLVALEVSCLLTTWCLTKYDYAFLVSNSILRQSVCVDLCVLVIFDDSPVVCFLVSNFILISYLCALTFVFVSFL